MTKQGYKEIFSILDNNHKEIIDEIRNINVPIKIDLDVNYLIDLAIEQWRLEKRIKQVTGSLDEPNNNGIKNTLARIQKIMSKFDIEVVDYTNKSYNPSLNVMVLNNDELSQLEATGESLIIKENPEPAVLIKGRIIRVAKVIVSK